MGRNSSMLVIQDDIYRGALHLDEVLLSAIPDAEDGAAAFAFVSKDGLNAIFNSEEFERYCQSGHHFDLIIGIDAITTCDTLEFARSLSSKYGGKLVVKVYYDKSTRDLFHAKTTWFKNCDGSGCVAFVGSGNLTRRGLQSNVEMFSWIEQDASSLNETVETWNGWYNAAVRAGRIYDTDDPEVLERASKNGFARRTQAGKVDASARAETLDHGERTMLVSAIPSQRTRGWSQFNMAKGYYKDFFGFSVDESGDKPRPTGSHRVLLSSVNDDGSLNPAESRGGVVVGSSNFRIELEAARNVEVLPGRNPMAVFLKIGPRSYLYQVYGTDSDINRRLADFARRKNASLRANELPKCLVAPRELHDEMPDLPIFNAEEDPDEQ